MEVLYVRYRILISDDEVDIVEMLTGFFRSKGYEVFSAYNGVETLKLAELQPDIILLDINMPKLDGIEVCKKIRDYVSCPILFLTARIEENDKVQGFSVGGDDYIVKPFSLVELEARVQAHLRIVLILSAVCKSQMIAFVISAAIYVIPIMLPISETSALYRIIVLMPLFYSQYISIMSVEQMHNGMLYAVWSIPVAIALVVIGSIISHKAFSKHQVR